MAILVRDATHLGKMMENRDVWLQFEVFGEGYSVRLGLKSAESLLRQARRKGREILAEERSDGFVRTLSLEVQPRSGKD